MLEIFSAIPHPLQSTPAIRLFQGSRSVFVLFLLQGCCRTVAGRGCSMGLSAPLITNRG